MSAALPRLCTYSLAHFWVDFCCALLMFSCVLDTPEWGLCVLLYNFCAFAMQMPIGLVADQLDRNSLVAALGCALVAVSGLLIPLPALAAVVAGLGNGCFHVGGGVEVLNASEKKSAALGVFVSPGAFGIYFGTILGKGAKIPWLIPAAVLGLFAAAFLLLDLRTRGSLRSGNAPVELDLTKKAAWAFLCCFLVVVLRSYVGMIFNFPWKTGGWSFAMVCAVVFGKAAGGFWGTLWGCAGPRCVPWDFPPCSSALVATRWWGWARCSSST